MNGGRGLGRGGGRGLGRGGGRGLGRGLGRGGGRGLGRGPGRGGGMGCRRDPGASPASQTRSPRAVGASPADPAAECPPTEEAGDGRMVVAVDGTRCAACGICVDACPQGAISMNGVAAIDAQLCTGCGDCVARCSFEALSLRLRMSVLASDIA